MSGLRISNLSYNHGSKTALDDISFAVEAGEFCALLGPNGAGKSTLFSLLTRLLVSPVGSIEIAGFNLRKSPRSALAKLGIVFQQTTLDLDLTVRQNLQYFAALHGLSGRNATRRIDAALDRLNMLDRAHEKARALNGGHKRRTEIARALIHNPLVLLLDEPTVGLDTATRTAITDHVHDLAADGTTVLWATHLTDEVRAHDHLVILHQARILADGKTHEVCGDISLQNKFLDLTSGTV